MLNSLIEELVITLPSVRHFHGPNTKLYSFLKTVARREIDSTFDKSQTDSYPKNFKPFGSVVFPYEKMGAIDTLDLFGLDELIIFSFYWTNRNKYKKVLDIGANLGLHSIIMEKCGFQVDSYEPDPTHFNLLTRNLSLNHSKNVSPFQCAVSTSDGIVNFVRVIGNTTSSHIAGSKSPYGELENLQVKAVNFSDMVSKFELIKMDVEGHEKQLLLNLKIESLKNTDIIAEISSIDNAKIIFEYFQINNINLFSQKTGWNLVKSIDNMPHSYKDGSLFVSTKFEMPWS